MQINHISRMTLVMSTIIFVLPLSAADWPRWLGPTGTGMAAEGCVLRDTIPEDLKPAWVHLLNRKSKTSGSPIVVDGVVYDISVATKARPMERRVLHIDKKYWKQDLKAFSKEHGEALKQLIENGKNHWPNQAAYESWRDQSAFTAEERKILDKRIVTEEAYSINTLFALNLFDGKEVFTVDWESSGMGWWGMHATPTVVDGVIYLVDGPGQIHARQATDGMAIWKSAEQVRGRYAGPNASPIVHGERLFLLTQKGVLALSIKDGSLLWSTRGDKESVYYTEDNSPAIFQNGDKTVLVVPQGHDRGGFLCGLDAETGALLWRIENGAKRYNTPVITGTTAILIHSKASRRGPGLHVFDLATTPPVQRLTIKANGGTSSPASDGTWVWWSDGDGAHCASLKDGSRRWDNADITENVYSSSVVCGHALILGHRKAECWYVVDTETGKLRHQQSIDRKLQGDRSAATPAVADGFVVIKTPAALIGYDLRP